MGANGFVKRTAILILVCTALLACGRLATRIGDINEHPDRYENKTVWVLGTVTTTAKLPGVKEGLYTLKDSTGEIAILTKGALPAEGSKRIVRGTVQSQFKIFGKPLAIVIREKG
jgi:hypothetical protein